MPFQCIRDPQESLKVLKDERNQAAQGKWEQIVEDLKNGRGLLSRKNAEGHIYGIRLNRSDRVVVAAHKNPETTDQELIVLGCFIQCHDKYEAFLKKAFTHYNDWVEKKIVSQGSVILLNGKRLAAASESEKESNLAEEPIVVEYQRYFNQAIVLTDEQENATTAKLPFVVLGPAGSGKTVSAILRLEQLAKEHVEDTPPIAYVGPAALINQLKLLWEDSAVENKDCVKLISVDDLLTEHLPLDHTLVGEQDFFGWFKNKKTSFYRDIKSTRSLESNDIYNEFMLIASLLEEDTYQNGSISRFDSGVKEIILNLFKAYLDQLKSESKINCSLTDLKSLNQIPVDFCSLLLVDEIQQWSVPMLSWLCQAPVPIGFYGDPHQCTIDPRLNNIKLIQHFFPKIKDRGFFSLHSTHRNPPAIAHCANALLKAKRNMVGRILKDGDEDQEFTSLRQHMKGQCNWHLHKTDTAIGEVSNIANSPDTAFVVFTEEDREAIKKTYKTELVFLVEEIVGLEFPNIIIFKPGQCLKKVDTGLWETIKATPESVTGRTKDKSLIHENQQAILNLNKLFVAVTRASRVLHFLTVKNNNKFTRDLKEICEQHKQLGGIDEEEKHPTTPPTVEEIKEQWHVRVRQLILTGVVKNSDIAKEVWKNNKLGSEDEFDSLCTKLQNNSTKTAAPIDKVLAATTPGSSTEAAVTLEPAPEKKLPSKSNLSDFRKNFKLNLESLNKILDDENWPCYLLNEGLDDKSPCILYNKIYEKSTNLFELINNLSGDNKAKIFKNSTFWVVATQYLSDSEKLSSKGFSKTLLEMRHITLTPLISSAQDLSSKENILKAMCTPATTDQSSKYAGLTIWFYIARYSAEEINFLHKVYPSIFDNDYMIRAFNLVRPKHCERDAGYSVWNLLASSNSKINENLLKYCEPKKQSRKTFPKEKVSKYIEKFVFTPNNIEMTLAHEKWNQLFLNEGVEGLSPSNSLLQKLISTPDKNVKIEINSHLKLFMSIKRVDLANKLFLNPLFWSILTKSIEDLKISNPHLSETTRDMLILFIKPFKLLENSDVLTAMCEPATTCIPVNGEPSDNEETKKTKQNYTGLNIWNHLAESFTEDGTLIELLIENKFDWQNPSVISAFSEVYVPQHSQRPQKTSVWYHFAKNEETAEIFINLLTNNPMLLFDQDHTLTAFSTDESTDRTVTLFNLIASSNAEKLMRFIEINHEELFKQDGLIRALTAFDYRGNSALTRLTSHPVCSNKLIDFISQYPHYIANDSLLAKGLSNLPFEHPDKSLWIVLCLDCHGLDRKPNDEKTRKIMQFFIRNIDSISNSPCIIKSLCEKITDSSLLDMLVLCIKTNPSCEAARHCGLGLLKILKKFHQIPKELTSDPIARLKKYLEIVKVTLQPGLFPMSPGSKSNNDDGDKAMPKSPTP